MAKSYEKNPAKMKTAGTTASAPETLSLTSLPTDIS